jgi:CBS domain-containing membrane protein
MTTRIFAVRPGAPVALLQNLMDEKRIRHVLVVDEEGALVGLVSQRDLIRSVSSTADGLPLSSCADLFEAIRAEDIMTQQVETVEADDDLSVAARVMLENKYGCLPVFEGGILAGIITEADFLRLLAELDRNDGA